MARQGLTQNYAINSGTLFEDFETIGDWTFSGAGGSNSVDMTHFKSGTKGLRITSANATAYTATKTINTTRFGNFRTMTLWLYVDDVTKLTQSGTAMIYVSSSATLATFYSWTFNVSRFRNGWNKLIIGKSEFTTSNGESWANTMVRLRFRILSVTGETAGVTLDSLVIDEYNRPKVIMTFDDGRISQYAEGYAYMQTKGIAGTLYLNINNLDSTAGYVTSADCQTMYDNNWDISTHGDDDLTTLADRTAIVADIEYNKSGIESKGWTRRDCHRHYAYPLGGYNDTTDLAFSDAGMLTGRTILTDTPHGLTSLPVDNYVRLKCGYITNATTLATVLARIDSAIAHGQTLILVFHSLVASPTVSTEWGISDFQSVVNYLHTKSNQKQLDVITMSEWYIGLTNPRRLANNRVTAVGRTAAVGRALVS